ncbi:MAG: hypothetical protein ACRDNP_10145, partial [Gaiellaceae bacterium]
LPSRVHARSFATRFLLQSGSFEREDMRRETSRVSFLMCPFCVRALLTIRTTISAPALMQVRERLDGGQRQERLATVFVDTLVQVRREHQQ